MASTSGLTVHYDYEPYRDVKTAVANSFKDRLISKYEYQYDRLGRRINVKNSGEAFEKGGFWLYGYNDRNEIATASRFVGDDLKDQSRPISDLERVYRFDPIGNRIDALEGKNEIQYHTNGLNQYERILAPSQKEEALIYDEDGNLIEDGRFRYSWNAENRLVEVESKVAAAGAMRLEFVYDYMGRRIRKEVFTFVNGGYIPSTEIRFAYDGWNMVKESKTEDHASVDRAVARDDAVTEDFLVFHAEVGATVLDERVPFLEAALVEQQLDPNTEADDAPRHHHETAARVTRLLVDLNRSVGHRHVFSEFTRDLPRRDRQAIEAAVVAGGGVPDRGVVWSLGVEVVEGADLDHLHRVRVQVHRHQPREQGRGSGRAFRRLDHRRVPRRQRADQRR